MRNNKIVLITGGTGNIGRSITEFYLNKGWVTIILSRRYNKSQLEKKWLAEHPGTFYFFEADLTQYENLKAVYSFIDSTYGKLDLLINCAGGLCSEENIKTTTPESFLKAFELNVQSVYNTCHRFIQLLTEARGLIINFSGGGATADQSNGVFVSYPVAKTALLRLTEILANQLAKIHISVFAIDPGWVPSEEDWQEINASKATDHLVDTSYICSPDKTPLLIDYLFSHRDNSISGKLFSVLDDYKATIANLKIGDNSDLLKLRLLKN
ncbi:MAG TPA: SDR family oxidoreductase [Gammaproteobacteria bacterium]|nr:SDR family oxidoreductase [Gammaproteobacteria bacterium]